MSLSSSKVLLRLHCRSQRRRRQRVMEIAANRVRTILGSLVLFNLKLKISKIFLCQMLRGTCSKRWRICGCRSKLMRIKRSSSFRRTRRSKLNRTPVILSDSKKSPMDLSRSLPQQSKKLKKVSKSCKISRKLLKKLFMWRPRRVNSSQIRMQSL